MAYRSFGRFRQASTHLDTPPFSQSHHPVSAIALEAFIVARGLRPDETSEPEDWAPIFGDIAPFEL